MAIDTGKLMAGIAPKGLTIVANTGATKPAIASTQRASTDTAANSESKDSSVSTGEEGLAKTEEGKKPEAKPGEQAQAKVSIDKAVKDTATPAPNQSKISTSEVINGIRDQWKKEAGATVPTETKPTDPIRDKVSSLQNDIANLSNGSGASRIQEATSDQKALVNTMKQDPGQFDGIDTNVKSHSTGADAGATSAQQSTQLAQGPSPFSGGGLGFGGGQGVQSQQQSQQQQINFFESPRVMEQPQQMPQQPSPENQWKNPDLPEAPES